jgi:hypothetical protein
MRLSTYFPYYAVPFIRHMLRRTVLSRIKKRFSPEYVEFLLIQMRNSPKLCAKCRKVLHDALAGKPNDAVQRALCLVRTSGSGIHARYDAGLDLPYGLQA